MAGRTKKTTARKPSTRKTPTKKPVADAVEKELKTDKPEANAKEPGKEPAELVQALDPKAFQMVMQIIDRADIKGSDAGAIINLRRELVRVANVKVRQ